MIAFRYAAVAIAADVAFVGNSGTGSGGFSGGGDFTGCGVSGSRRGSGMGSGGRSIGGAGCGSSFPKFFNWALGKNIIETNPALGIPDPAAKNVRDRVLTDGELRIIWLAADGEGYPFGDVIKLLALTGQRRLEVSGASWPEFDLKARTWLLPSARTKNARTHLVPLSDAALDVLTGLPRFADGPFLFGL